MWYPLWSILVCKIPKFLAKKLPIQTTYHTFLESSYLEVTKNSYVLSPEWSQKRYQLMDYIFQKQAGQDFMC